MMGEMDHHDVRDMLEDAALEPDGLERLMAGDTPTAALVAGHLAGCPDCAEELARLHRAAGLIRPVVRSAPSPELRQRTLAYVAAVGRPRGQSTAPGATPVATEPPRPVAPAPEVPERVAAPFAGPTAAPARTRPGRLPALVGLAAALIVAVAGTGVVVNATRDADVRAQAEQVEALGKVARWTLRIDSRPDVRRIALTSTSGASTTASLVFSPSTTELVVVAEQLAPPPAGREYRCWLEVDGTRASIGKMYFGGDLAYWVGDVALLAGLGPGARFGVSLVDLTGSGPGEPVLVGSG